MHKIKGQSKKCGLTRTLKVSTVLKIFSKPVCLHFLLTENTLTAIKILTWLCLILHIKKSRTSLNSSSGKGKTGQGMAQSQHSLRSCFSRTVLNKQ